MQPCPVVYEFVRALLQTTTANYFNKNLNGHIMKEGAMIGAIVALLVYFMLPIYGDHGQPASILPTANVVSDPASFSSYIGNLPFSMIIFFALEILGISIGAAAQFVFRKSNQTQQ